MVVASVAVASPTLVYRDDPLYVRARQVALAAGGPAPPLTSPITHAELDFMLSCIEADRLEGELLAEYLELRRLLVRTADDPLGTIGLRATGELYLHTSDDPAAWRYWYPDRRPALSLPIRAWPVASLYVEFDLDWRRNYPFFPGTTRQVADPDPMTNIPFDPLTSDVQFPFRGLISLAGERWSVQFGRSRVSMGSGVAGSLFLSDHVDYHEYLMASVYGRLLTYRALYLDLEPWVGASQQDSLADRMFFAHRIEMRPFPWLSLAANDGFILADRPIELRYLNPLMIMHSWFIPQYGNSLLNFEFAVRPVAGLEVYGHFAIEQLQSAVEQERGYAEDDPDAFGYLAGIEYARPLSFGWLTVGTEWAFLDPWMYIGRTVDNSFTWRRLVQAEHVIPSGAKMLVEKPLGYPAGADYYEVLVHARADLVSRYAIAAQARFAAKGENQVGRSPDVVDAADALRRTPSGDAPEYIVHGRVAANVLLGRFTLRTLRFEAHTGAVLDVLRVTNRGFDPGTVLRDVQFSPYLSVTLGGQ